MHARPLPAQSVHGASTELAGHRACATQVNMSHGTLRAVYVQRGRCAVSAGGLDSGGGSESASCGGANAPSCLVAWLSRFNPFQVATAARAPTLPPLPTPAP